MKNYISLGFCALIFIFECSAQTSLEAHIHGEAELNIVLENQNLLIELRSPSFNLVGFEHKPKNMNQKQVVLSTIKLLENPKNIFQVSSDAECRDLAVSVTSSMEGIVSVRDEHHGDEHHGDEHHEKEVHSEFVANYSMVCEKPENFKFIGLKLFNSFELMEEVKVQWIIQEKQGFEELTPDGPNLEF